MLQPISDFCALPDNVRNELLKQAVETFTTNYFYADQDIVSVGYDDKQLRVCARTQQKLDALPNEVHITKDGTSYTIAIAKRIGVPYQAYSEPAAPAVEFAELPETERDALLIQAKNIIFETYYQNKEYGMTLLASNPEGYIQIGLREASKLAGVPDSIAVHMDGNTYNIPIKKEIIGTFRLHAHGSTAEFADLPESVRNELSKQGCAKFSQQYLNKQDSGVMAVVALDDGIWAGVEGVEAAQQIAALPNFVEVTHDGVLYKVLVTASVPGLMVTCAKPRP